MVPRLGLEPRIYSLEGCCLIHSAIGAWWALQDSNLRPSDYESPALTTELKALLASYSPAILASTPPTISAVQTIMILADTLPFIHPQTNAIRLPIPQTNVRMMEVIPRPVLPCLNICTQVRIRHAKEPSPSTNDNGVISVSIILFKLSYNLRLLRWPHAVKIYGV